MSIGVSAATAAPSPTSAVSGAGGTQAARSSPAESYLRGQYTQMQGALQNARSGGGAAAPSGGGGSAAATSGGGGEAAGGAGGAGGAPSSEQSAMLAQQQAADKQSEEAALKSGLEKSRHDSIMAIVQKIG